jgi:CRP-like cAMP-binding protein/tRNA A-37 threonylcarbamoyl transferase component Bud32
MPASPDDRTLPSGRARDGKEHGDTASVQGPAHRSSDAPPGAAPAPPADIPPGPTLDSERFQELEVIAGGGSSIVVRAFDRVIERTVAIKVLKPGLDDDDLENERFAKEARIHGKLEHPNIVPIYDFGRDRRGRRYLCMKLIEGVTLENALKALGDARLESTRLAEFLQVFVKVCDAVSFAHGHGVIHRDLKPSNIMMNDFGQVYVLDWGIARLRTAGPMDLDPPGSLVGTTQYMAPEQMQGLHGELNARTEVFALGAVLYHVLTGHAPVTQEILLATRHHQTPPPIVPPEQMVAGARVPPELSSIAVRAMSYDPAERYASAADLKRAVESFLRGAWDLPRTRLPAGRTIVTEGEPGNAAYVIVGGKCMAYRVEDEEEVSLRIMGPGDVFGETAVFSEKPRTASVKALTDVVLIVVTREVIASALGLNSWMGAFVKALADRFREVDQRLRAYERPSTLPGAPPTSPRATSREAGDRATPIVAKVKDIESLRRAAAGLPCVSLPAGSIVVAQGGVGDAGYAILQGRCVEVRLEGTMETTRRAMEAGEVFGEMALLSEEPSAVTVKATTDVELVVVKRDVLASALGLDSWMGTFVKTLADRLRDADERLRGMKGESGATASLSY